MPDRESERQALLVAERVARISPLLHGIGADAQGGVLADLVAMWLAGHVVPGDPALTAVMRDDMLALWVDTMRQLIGPNAEISGAADVMRGGARRGSA